MTEHPSVPMPKHLLKSSDILCIADTTIFPKTSLVNFGSMYDFSCSAVSNSTIFFHYEMHNRDNLENLQIVHGHSFYCLYISILNLTEKHEKRQ